MSRKIAFFSVAVRRLDANSALLTGFAEKAYTDEEMAFELIRRGKTL